MADSTNGKKAHGEGAPQQSSPPIQAQVQIIGQYIKDLSFENPNVGKLIKKPDETPNLKIEVNVNAQRLAPDLYESGIDFKASATSTAGTIYDLELVYAGLFKIANLPENALEPFLLIHCPALIFPFLRRLVADLTREGGFPPLLLDPIDFAGLFLRRQKPDPTAAKPKT
ncbi:MAG TPA: protein-export chaperone SecB [Hyphomicrobiaceae bacterium]|nr:protein-export chaperone SecB [Hyphomicrobiaceae bacterium]